MSAKCNCEIKENKNKKSKTKCKDTSDNVSNKSEKCKKKEINDKNKRENQKKEKQENYFEYLPCNLKKCKSHELRAGVLYTTCDCNKRNGLQDNCQRTCCFGSPQCKSQPEPKCCPSQFPRKYLKMSMGIRKLISDRIF